MSASIIRNGVWTVEAFKYAEDLLHASQVHFTNEMGNLCEALQIDINIVESLPSLSIAVPGT